MRSLSRVLMALAGALFCSLAWAAGEVISINFASSNKGNGATYNVDTSVTNNEVGLAEVDVDGTKKKVPGSAWTNLKNVSGVADAKVYNGTEIVNVNAPVKVTYKSDTTWEYTGTEDAPVTDAFLKSYLEDGTTSDGWGAQISVDVPFTTYDVYIYFATDPSKDSTTSKGGFRAPQVNGEFYTANTSTEESNTTKTTTGNVNWGEYNLKVATLGKNTLWVQNQSGTLDIKINPKDGDNRGCVAAIQIVNKDASYTEETPTLNQAFNKTFDYVFTGTTTDYDTVSNWTCYNDNVLDILAPGLTNSEKWGPILIDGNQMDLPKDDDGYKAIVSSENFEGWALTLGLKNHAKLTIEKLVKLQGSGWVYVDETSKLVVSGFSTNAGGWADDVVAFNISAPEGLVFNQSDSDESGKSRTYHLDKKGSVKYDYSNQARTHKVMSLTLDLGATNGVAALMKRPLIIVDTPADTTAATQTYNALGGVTTTLDGVSAVAKENDGDTLTDVGHYRKVVENNSLYVEYMGYAVAEVNGYGYHTLKAAIEAAGETESTITLLTDITETDAITIGANQNITLVAGNSYTAETPLTISTAITNNGSLTTEGYITMSSGSNKTTGTLIVNTGILKMNAQGNGQGFYGTLEIKRYAEFQNYSSWTMSVDTNNPVTIDVRGTLNLRDTTWTIASGANLNLYPGGTLTGTQNNAQKNLQLDGGTINLNSDTTVTDTTVATIVGFLPILKDTQIVIADEMTLDLSATSTGTGLVSKQGAGTLVLNGTLQASKGLKIEGGTVKFGTKSCFGKEGYTESTHTFNTPAYCNIEVCTEAVLDYNGKADNWVNIVTLHEGATIKNSASGIGNNNRLMKGIALQGNATIDIAYAMGLIAPTYGPTSIDLGTYTLTKKGTGSFYLGETTISGTGSIVKAQADTGFSTSQGGASDNVITIDGVVTFEGDDCFASGMGVKVNAAKSVTFDGANTLAALTLGEGATLAVTNTQTVTTVSYPSALTVSGPVDTCVLQTASAPTGTTFTTDATTLKAVYKDGGLYIVKRTWAQDGMAAADTAWATSTEEGAPDGTAEHPYIITNAEELAGLAKLVTEGNTFAGETITLGNDIDLTGYAWPGIGVFKKFQETATGFKPFEGTFDGKGFAVENMTFSTDVPKYHGFFNAIANGAIVKNLTVKGNGFGFTEEPTTGEYGGAFIAGGAYGATIEKCVTEGTFIATHNVAGLVVSLQDTQITACVNNVNLSNKDDKIGGLVCLTEYNTAEVGSAIKNCTNNGTVTITSTNGGTNGVGGLIGYANHGAQGGFVTIEQCHSLGAITIPEANTVARVGQIVGYPNADLTGKVSGNTGLASALAIGANAWDGLAFATVAEGVATYVKNAELAAGETYLVTAKEAKPSIKLAAGQSITFDTSLASIDDDSAITADSAIITTVDGNKTTYAPAVASVGETNYATLEAAIEAAVAGDTVTLLADVELTAGVTIAKGKTVVLDLAGFTVSYTSSETTGNAAITNRGTLTITDSSEAGTGKITYLSNSPSATFAYASNTILNCGTLTINGGTIANTTNNNASFAIDNNSSGANAVLTINGGLVVAQVRTIRQFANSTTCENTVAVNGGVVQSLSNRAIWIQAPSTAASKAALTITGGKVTTAGLSAVSVSSQGSLANTTVTIEGGTLEGQVTLNTPDSGATLTETATVTISGGTFKKGTGEYEGGIVDKSGADDVADKISVSGGTFCAAIPEDFCANGFIPEANDDGTYGVKSGTYVAQVGTTKYETLDAALATANGATVTLIADVTISATTDFTSGTTTLDLGGKTVTLADGVRLGATGASTVLNIKNGTINGNRKGVLYLIYQGATLNMTGVTTTNAYTTDPNGNLVQIGSNLDYTTGCATIENCTLSATTTALMVLGDKTDDETADTKVTVKNSELSAKQPVCGNGNCVADLTIEGANTVITGTGIGVYWPGAGTLTVSDGTITGATAVYVKSGDVTIAGGTIEATGAVAAYNPVGNGAYATGDAIVVENCAYPFGAPTVKITGGTITTAGGKQLGAYYNEEEGVTEIADITNTNTTLAAPEGYEWNAAGKLVKEELPPPGVTYDMDDFKADLLASVTNGNYVFDGEGKTYAWTIGNEVNNGDDNAPDRYNSRNAQYFLLNGEAGAVTLKNVNFVFTAPEGNAEGKVTGNIIGAPTAVNAAQLYFENTGDFTVENCSFDKVVLTNFYGEGTTTITGCTFANCTDTYAMKDIRGKTITVTDNKITNCSGGVMVSAVSADSEIAKVTITGNTFTNIGAEGTKDRGLVQLAADGVYAEDAVTYEENTATDCVASTFWQDNVSAAPQVQQMVDANSSLTMTDDSTKLPAVATVGTTKYYTLATAIAAAPDGATVKVIDETTVDKTINITKSVTIDLNGKAVTANVTTGQVFKIATSDVAFTLMDSTETKAGSITAKAPIVQVFNTTSNVAVTVSGGTYTMAGTAITDYTAAFLMNGALTEITEGVEVITNIATFENATIDSEAMGIYVAKTTATIEGCTITSGTHNATAKYNAALGFAYGATATLTNNIVTAALDVLYVMNSGATVTVNGGEYTAGTEEHVLFAYEKKDGPAIDYIISAGTFKGNWDITGDIGFTITGGYFTVNPAAHLGAGYYATKEGDLYTVIQNPVAQVASTELYYADLQTAITAANAGDTVTVVANAAANVTIGKSLTIDLNGHTLTNATDSTDQALLRICAPDADTAIAVIINATNGGGITTTGDCLPVYSGHIDCADTTLTINGGEYDSGWFSAVYQNNGLCTINGGSYKSAENERLLDNFDGSGGDFMVTGGTFYEFNPACMCINDGEHHNHENIASGKTTEYADGWYTVVEGESNLVAQVESIYDNRDRCYNSLADAIAAAGDGDTVILLKDIVLEDTVTIAKKVTLDLAGKTLSNTTGLWDNNTKVFALITVVEGGDLTITGNGSVIALKDDCYAVELKAGKATIENGTFNGNLTSVYVQTGELIINGGTYDIQQTHDSANPNQPAYSLVINCTDANYDEGKAKITINGGTFKNWNPSCNAAEGPHTHFTPEGKVGTLGEDGWYTVEDGNLVAQTDTACYATLAEAMADVEAGETLTVLDPEASTNGAVIVSTTQGKDVADADALVVADLFGGEFKVEAGTDGTPVELHYHYEFGISAISVGKDKNNQNVVLITVKLMEHGEAVERTLQGTLTVTPSTGTPVTVTNPTLGADGTVTVEVPMPEATATVTTYAITFSN